MRYDTVSDNGLNQFRDKNAPITLSIETSCDETAAAVLRGGREVISTSVFTQIPMHREFGGVVPELASRSHVLKIRSVVEDALLSAKMTFSDIDGIAVTNGPGLLGALLVGLSYAKSLAYALSIPYVGVNHIAGHIASNYLSYPDLKPPFICLVASGGHSHVLEVKGYNSFSVLGQTRDDAAGEAFDKVARILGLPYPGGPELEKLAKIGDKNAYEFKSTFNNQQTPDFSFSGIKTAVINTLHTEDAKKIKVKNEDIAAAFQYSVVQTLANKTVLAAQRAHSKIVALAGGVSANNSLRETMAELCEKNGMTFYCPTLKYCTDNGAMIGCAGYYLLKDGINSSLSLNAQPNLALHE
ncbi:MAG: tRNA (adenosine(37)-N6)-threonylcarbamoyltransferase complex transferase subunit TsaD [Clostridia bacterium]